jgi:hypothetical protein
VQKSDLPVPTKTALATVALSIFKRLTEANSPVLAQFSLDIRKEWGDLLTVLKDVYLKKIEKNALTEEESSNWVDWEEWEHMDKLLSSSEPGSPTQLLVAFHVRFPPLRGGDLTYVDFCHKEDALDQEGNFITDIDRPGQSVLYVREHKTAKTYGELIRVIPESLKKEINISLESFPRTLLFVRPNGEPYTSESTFIDWKRNVFKRLFNRNVTTNSARHAYVSSGDFNTLSIEAQRRRALELGHSEQMHQQYRKIK